MIEGLGESTAAEKDGGIEARDRLSERAVRLAWEATMRTVAWLCFAAVVVVATIAGYAWQTRVPGVMNDPRVCSVTVGNVEIRGLRTFTYPYVELLGVRTMLRGHTSVRTVINLPGKEITVRGISGKDKLWTKQDSSTATGEMILDKADLLIFTIAKNGDQLIADSDFCK